MTTLSKVLIASAKGFMRSSIMPNHVLRNTAERKIGAPASRNIKKEMIREFFIDFILAESEIEKAEKIMTRSVPIIAR
jgi:hypothetical protein